MMVRERADDDEGSRQSAAVDQPAGELWWLLMEVANLGRRLAERRLALVHTSPDQIHALRAIAVRDRLTVGEIADAVGLERNSASQLVERLVQQGLVRRDRSTVDRRQAFVSVSDAGKALLAAGEPNALALAEELLAEEPRANVVDSARILREIRARATRLLAGTPAPCAPDTLAAPPPAARGLHGRARGAHGEVR